jgi:hypothetical protein
MTGGTAMTGTAGPAGAYWSGVGGGRHHSDGVTRTYYISADEVRWDYAPTGRNQITGRPFDDVADVFVTRGRGAPGPPTARLYRGYTDGTFTHRAVRPADERHLGVLGPVIGAEVGDTRWCSATPAPSRPRCIPTGCSTPRTARARRTRTAPAGRQGRRPGADGSSSDVDGEVFDLFSVRNENQSPYLGPNVEECAEGEPDPEEEGFEESNLMHSVNGFV